MDLGVKAAQTVAQTVSTLLTTPLPHLVWLLYLENHLHAGFLRLGTSSLKSSSLSFSTPVGPQYHPARRSSLGLLQMLFKIRSLEIVLSEVSNCLGPSGEQATRIHGFFKSLYLTGTPSYGLVDHRQLILIVPPVYQKVIRIYK